LSRDGGLYLYDVRKPKPYSSNKTVLPLQDGLPELKLSMSRSSRKSKLSSGKFYAKAEDRLMRKIDLLPKPARYIAESMQLTPS
jgi:hypothetical protein